MQQRVAPLWMTDRSCEASGSGLKSELPSHVDNEGVEVLRARVCLGTLSLLALLSKASTLGRVGIALEFQPEAIGVGQ